MRPDGEPDWEMLRKVVERVEELKRLHGRDSKKINAWYRSQIGDTYSISYLAANRVGLNIPEDPTPELAELMTNGWVEGFLFGVLFERLRATGDLFREPAAE